MGSIVTAGRFNVYLPARTILLRVCQGAYAAPWAGEERWHETETGR